MVKVILPQIGIDPDLFERIELERKKTNTPRATYINQKLRESHNLNL